MQKRFQKLSLVVSASLGLALMLPGSPAEASEVVKLARLVITGKRLSAERLELVAVQKTAAPVQQQAKSLAPSPVLAGQDVTPRAAAAQSRGLLSFF